MLCSFTSPLAQWLLRKECSPPPISVPFTPFLLIYTPHCSGNGAHRGTNTNGSSMSGTWPCAIFFFSCFVLFALLFGWGRTKFLVCCPLTSLLGSSIIITSHWTVCGGLSFVAEMFLFFSNTTFEIGHWVLLKATFFYFWKIIVEIYLLILTRKVFQINWQSEKWLTIWKLRIQEI